VQDGAPTLAPSILREHVGNLHASATESFGEKRRRRERQRERERKQERQAAAAESGGSAVSLCTTHALFHHPATTPTSSCVLLTLSSLTLTLNATSDQQVNLALRTCAGLVERMRTVEASTGASARRPTSSSSSGHCACVPATTGPCACVTGGRLLLGTLTEPPILCHLLSLAHTAASTSAHTLLLLRLILSLDSFSYLLMVEQLSPLAFFPMGVRHGGSEAAPSDAPAGADVDDAAEDEVARHVDRVAEAEGDDAVLVVRRWWREPSGITAAREVERQREVDGEARGPGWNQVATADLLRALAEHHEPPAAHDSARSSPFLSLPPPAQVPDVSGLSVPELHQLIRATLQVALAPAAATALAAPLCFAPRQRPLPTTASFARFHPAAAAASHLVSLATDPSVTLSPAVARALRLSGPEAAALVSFVTTAAGLPTVHALTHQGGTEVAGPLSLPVSLAPRVSPVRRFALKGHVALGLTTLSFSLADHLPGSFFSSPLPLPPSLAATVVTALYTCLEEQPHLYSLALSLVPLVEPVHFPLARLALATLAVDPPSAIVRALAAAPALSSSLTLNLPAATVAQRTLRLRAALALHEVPPGGPSVSPMCPASPTVHSTALLLHLAVSLPSLTAPHPFDSLTAVFVYFTKHSYGAAGEDGKGGSYVIRAAELRGALRRWSAEALAQEQVHPLHDTQVEPTTTALSLSLAQHHAEAGPAAAAAAAAAPSPLAPSAAVPPTLAAVVSTLFLSPAPVSLRLPVWRTVLEMPRYWTPVIAERWTADLEHAERTDQTERTFCPLPRKGVVGAMLSSSRLADVSLLRTTPHLHAALSTSLALYVAESPARFTPAFCASLSPSLLRSLLVRLGWLAS